MNSCETQLKHLNGKKIIVNLKHGYNLDDFIRKYNCNEDEFLNFLQKNFESTSYKKILAEMKKNSKKKNLNKNTKKSTKDFTTDSEFSSDISETMNNYEKETSMEVDTINSESNPERISDNSSLSNSIKKHETLKALKEKEQILISEIFSKENVHTDLISRRKVLFKQLRKQKELMLELQKLIEQRQKDVEQISVDLIEISDKIVSINESISAGKHELLTVQANIKELEKISIFIYENGETDTDDFHIDLPETWSDVFENIIRCEIVEDLSVKQIKQLAKLLVLTDILKDSSLYYELTFESEIAQKAFYQLEKTMS